MSMKLPRLALSGLVLAVAFGGQALAADAKQIADALVAAATASGDNQASYDSATASGDDITVTGFKVTKGDQTVTVPPMTISGAQPRDKGGFTAAKMSIAPGNFTDSGQTFAWQTAVVQNAVVPSPDEVKAHAHITPFSQFDMTGMSISGDRMPAAVTIDSLGVGVVSDAEGAPQSFSVKLAKLNLPPEFFAKNMLAAAYLQALGYSGFVINMDVEGSYQNGSDTLNLQTFAIDTVDVGKLTFSGKFSGVSLRKLSDVKTAQSVESTGKLESFTVRFDNSGIVERLFDMQAKTQGIKREEAVAQAAAGLPFILNLIGNQGFQDKVSAAATTFLNSPKSITFSATPSEPVPFSKLYETIGQAPETLPDLLSANVTAND